MKDEENEDDYQIETKEKMKEKPQTPEMRSDS